LAMCSGADAPQQPAHWLI